MKTENLKSLVKRAIVWGPKGIKGYLCREWRERKIRKFLLLNARQFPGAPTERGITLIAPLSGCYSLSKTVRDFATSLKASGIPFQAIDIFTERNRASKDDYAHLLTPLSEFRINRYTHIVEMFKSPLSDKLLPWAKGKHRGRIAFWEGATGMLDVFPYLGNGNAVIAMSDFNDQHFRNELRPTTSPVFKILYPFMWPTAKPPSRETMRKRYSIGQNDFVVFYNFDLGSSFRKNADGAMRSFAMAFNGIPSARLVYKINGCNGHPDKLSALKQLAVHLGISDRFTTVESYIPQNDLYGLTAAADVYLSLHRAEGFGLGIAEAMFFGIPAVVTNYSAPTEFCNSDTAMLVPYKLIPIKRNEYFASMREWAEPDEQAAASALRELFDNSELRHRIGAAGKLFIRTHFSLESFRQSVNDYLNA